MSGVGKALVVQDLARVSFEHGGLTAVHYADGGVVVSVRDDDPRVRWRFRFPIVHGLRITSSDCFDYAGVLIDSKLSRHLVELTSSPWVKALAAELREHEAESTRLEGARHYVLTFHDQVVEIVASGVKAESVPMRFVGGQWVE